MPVPTLTADLDIQRLCQLQEQPEPFAPGEPQFWTDPHIARQMLAAHLDPNNDLASRRPCTIDRSVDWIVTELELRPGDSVLDLGCGPGLYASRLARRGLHMTGVDFSQNSLDYARAQALQDGLSIDYRCQDYLLLDDVACFDVALLIYGDLCPLSPRQRIRLLGNVRRALKPEGRFVLDVSTPRLHQRAGSRNHWYAVETGFWKAGPHLVLEQGFVYEGDLHLDQYIVVEPGGKTSVYRNWFQDYTAESIRAEVESNAFAVQSLWADLTGAPLEAASDWIGVVARPRP